MSNLYKQWPDLELLHLLLANEDMARSPDVWFNIHQLLFLRISQDNCPETPEAIASLLGPLVCKNPQQQQRLLSIIKQWLTSKTPLVQATVTAPKLNKASPSVNWHQRLSQFNRRYLQGTAVLISLLVLLALGIGDYQQSGYYPITDRAFLPKYSNNISGVQGIDSPEKMNRVKPSVLTPSIGKPIDSPKTIISITNWVKPNVLTPPIKLSTVWQDIAYIIIIGLPIVTTLLWLIWRYRSRKILREQQAEDDNQITGLSFKHSDQVTAAPFAGPEIIRAANRLIRPFWIKSQQLDLGATVVATANHFGFFTPIFEQRPVQPKYIVLVQSIHGKDQVTDVAKLLVDELTTLNVAISSYRFRDDPRRLIPWTLVEGDKNTVQSLTELALKSENTRLIVISDWDILFHPYQPEQPQAWITELEAWKQRIWLSPGYDNPKWAERAREQAQSINIRLLSLAGENIQNLANWLSQDGNPPAPEGQIDEDYILPEIFTQTSESWLEWRPPHGINLKILIAQLHSYLGDDGFLLLQALAVFPKPLWPILQMLDIELFSSSRHSAILKTDIDQQRHDREKRLVKISRLPWSRHAYMPDYIRERLLKALNHKERKSISKIWRDVLAQLISNEGYNPIDIPIAVPKKNTLNLQYWLDTQTKKSALSDAIFVNILLGHKLGLLDFRLPQALDKLLPGASKWLDLRPALTAIILAGLSVWGLDWAWQYQGKAALSQYLQVTNEPENAQWPVEMVYQTDTHDLAIELQKKLTTLKFPAKAQLNKNQIPNEPNAINYAPGGQAVAQRVAEQLVWLTYGAIPKLVQSASLPAYSLQVQLTQTYQPTAVFNDEMTFESTFNKDVKTVDVLLEPKMVDIKPGTFKMGSSAKEVGRSDDEGPQHQVTLARPFAIGQYEVTVKEYAQFAEATGRKAASNNDWKGDTLPVTNVNIDDAQAYTVWLSQQTGKAYRLPSEAEWEYVARAGSTSAYWWGDSIGKNHAVCNGCGSQWDGEQAAPVGSFKANKFGVYDTAGNVWELTQDCWHDNYDSAPDDGSAWLEADKGDCSRRVVRGGSWYDYPQYLRSAGRDWFLTDAASNLSGFRVARAL
ncbi:MAG: formylglycine-generating enzyme family protein [Methylococcales bacterium]